MSEEKPEPGISPSADWRDTVYYMTARRLDLFGWCSEWLLRNPRFQWDIKASPCRCIDGGCGKTIHCPSAGICKRWGACCCEIEGKPVICWSPDRNPLVLRLDAIPTTCRTTGIDCRQCPLLKAVMHMGATEQQLLFSDGVRHLQLAINGADALDGPLLLRCTLCGIGEFESKPILLRRLAALARHKRFLSSLYPDERRAYRWADMLRAFDGAAAGASHREIAAVIYGERPVTEDWDDLYRVRFQRLLRGARGMVNGGYRKLLGQVGEEKGGSGGVRHEGQEKAGNL